MPTQGTYSKSPSDITESQPEAGLAEWTSKIKAMQRQVDADEEAEQNRLEQEIAASRLARIRRSQGLGYGNRSTSSLDVSSLADEAEGSSRSDVAHGDTSTAKASVVRQSNHADALQKLVGSPPYTTPTLASKEPSTKAVLQNETKPQAISLAAFMGGRATGPRLNKPIPQQDAHDPTQFEQRTRNQAPHPLFGSGGVAMPGITVRRDGPAKPSGIAALSKANSATLGSEPPPATQKYAETYQRMPPLPHSPEMRERTKSTPSYVGSSSRSALKQETSTPSLKVTASTLTNSRTDIKEQVSRSRSPSPAGRPTTPHQGVDAVITPSKSPIAVASLAGPIRPQPRPSTSISQIPPSVTPSKAFLRSPIQKEPTPSLSRLQGRGFVQNMVKVSSQLESPPSSGPGTPEKNKPASGRRSSVLDRWQPKISSSTPSPPVSPSPRSPRRSVTVDSNVGEKAQASVVEFSGQRATSTQSSTQENIPPYQNPFLKANGSEKRAGLGSTTTLVVFKPEPIKVPPVDEFGVKPNHVSKPLSHPTKGRARKPRKHRTTSSDAKSIDTENLEAGFLPPPPPPSRPVEITNEAQSSIYPRSQSPIPETRRTSSPKPVTQLLPAPLIGLPQAPTATDQIIRRALPGLGKVDDLKSVPQHMHALDKIESVSIRHPLPGLTPAGAGGKRPLPSPSAQKADDSPKVNHGVARRALPGMTSPAHEPKVAVETKPTPQQHGSQPFKNREETTSTPPSAKYTRSLSTGGRPTAMDVAQTLSEYEGSEDLTTSSDALHSPGAAQVGSRGPFPSQIDKRKSSYDKYSSIILPPLKEEATPTPTPTSTLSRKDGNAQKQTLEEQGRTSRESVSSKPLHAKTTTLASKNPFPEFDIDDLLHYNTRPVHLDSATTTISVEVLAITGTTATTLYKDKTIFYDTEILAIIHRSKSQKSGLASTEVWGWEGQRAKLGEREQRKLQELAKRYGTTVSVVHQYSETPYFVHTLGGVLAIRQGTRAHWSSENTAMHLVRSLSGVIIVDEMDLNMKNLCSAYSYCVSILDSVYVWYGRGSTPLERTAALEYGRSLTTTLPPVELREGGGGDDEMFWMVLGEDDYAEADYWKWRRTSPITDPRVWQVKAGFGKNGVTTVDSLSNEFYIHDAVYIIDAIWELYVMVTVDARAQRQDVDLALRLALEISIRVSPARPYPPTVHVLILPSQLPKDLKLMFRGLDESSLNKGDMPDHMNLLSAAEARSHLDTFAWNDLALRDQTMLPLGVGVDPSHPPASY